MTAYLIRRILFFIPTLLLITLLSFIISQSAPGDPVEQMLSGQQSGGEQLAERQANEAAYLQKRKDLGLDLPVFFLYWAAGRTRYLVQDSQGACAGCASSSVV